MQKSGFMSFEDFKKILTCRFSEVALHGWGEPMLNGDIFRMIAYAKSLGMRTSVTTNGTFVGKYINEILDSGLDSIAFGYYDTNILMKSIDNLEDLLKERKERGSKLAVYLDITLYKDNREEIIRIIKESSEIGVDAAVLHRLFNIYVDSPYETLSSDEEREFFRILRELGRELRLKIYMPRRHTLPCRIVKNTIFVTYDGKITPCCFLPEYFVGDAHEESIESVLKSEKYRKFVKNMEYHDVCSRCIW